METFGEFDEDVSDVEEQLPVDLRDDLREFIKEQADRRERSMVGANALTEYYESVDKTERVGIGLMIRRLWSWARLYGLLCLIGMPTGYTENRAMRCATI